VKDKKEKSKKTKGQRKYVSRKKRITMQILKENEL